MLEDRFYNLAGQWISDDGVEQLILLTREALCDYDKYSDEDILTALDIKGVCPDTAAQFLEGCIEEKI